MSNVVDFPEHRSKLTADKTLEACEGQYDKLVVLGVNKDDNLEFWCSGGMCNQEALWSLEKYKQVLLNEEE